ncbi:TIGR03088 family PEP-CTERM/XrtA system glycosyltransferase [Rheinheimera maricola]|uniref:TIGR03088 family PEP-CTERM/XrtA system glycosyltransferase n=1 Tax=Rheinheimera maricola TaxID=2793282 RepID=A0ABS7X854_9GAMM|nr:TIGR03088 family PEP-CTERM/XrtA system glycosyltransferase [Rheinheimera maricola]MBZ9611723.1 TIGR03088 family PEP-CTERM/XrtA system glycosyltransferase [Rheinheimera maricola]
MTETDNPPIHIVHLLWHFSTGGLENGVVNLINHLPSQQFRHSIVSLTGHDPQFARRIQTDNVSLYSLEKQAGHDWGTFSRLNRLLKTLQPDVLHSRNLATLELQIIGWWRKVPLRLHGEHGWDSNDIGGCNKKNRLLRQLLKNFVQRFICLSTESERYLTNIIGISSSRVERICNGVQIEKFSQASPAVLSLPAAITQPAPLIFATVGRLATVKNQALLLRSFALLLQQHPQQRQRCTLVIVGDGPCRQALLQLSAELSIEQQVLFTGNRDDIAQLMQRFSVFVLPSLAEGISNTLLEAMAAGTPIIATDVGGNRDLMPQVLLSRNLVPSDDSQQLMLAMQNYLLQPDLLRADAELVKNHCHQHFSIDTMVNRYRKLYEMTRTQT